MTASVCFAVIAWEPRDGAVRKAPDLVQRFRRHDKTRDDHAFGSVVDHRGLLRMECEAVDIGRDLLDIGQTCDEDIRRDRWVCYRMLAHFVAYFLERSIIVAIYVRFNFIPPAAWPRRVEAA